ncbi:hypothetical protein M409DRAFT_54184 [Zasmidium cellare ATCC 36951]|uniref:Uncharacterized protein n=1 Tax=Zasmidium cellare ATCC 36951 TaxID=1080233 RepID=A0A6A6CKB4_ZASCE|nr:uncharacterized protein M409DRAFT_54184 [Zasmidium cellare ATCC 36951]KAF2167595.1 hypothetical protein M409DRAFT_54184 [Zasmidium cellare ATCC 36951]
MSRGSPNPSYCPPNMSDDKGQVLLSRLVKISTALSGRSREVLEPFKGEIRTLSHIFGVLDAKLNNEAADSTSLSESPFGAASRRTSPIKTTIQDLPELAAPICLTHASNTEIHQIFHQAWTHFCSSQARFEQLKSCSTFGWFDKDVCLLHLSYISSLNQHRRFRELELSERLLLLCSCMSFAAEFRDFERRNGWIAKEDSLLSSLLEGVSPAVQRIKKNTKAFYDELGISRAEEGKVATGLRLGTKLNVVERIGRQHGFSAFLSLLLVFELARIYRIRYDSLLNLIPSLRDGSEAFAPIRLLAGEYGPWWEACQSRYSAKFVKPENHQDKAKGSSVNTMYAAFDEGVSFPEPPPLNVPDDLPVSLDSHPLFDESSLMAPSFGLEFEWPQV